MIRAPRPEIWFGLGLGLGGVAARRYFTTPHAMRAPPPPSGFGVSE